MQVRWSNRMTLCAGQFQFNSKTKKDLKYNSEIVLSEPLLKMRPKRDTINTLLHEMIHAYLFVTCTKDDDDHGTHFKYWMNFINEAETSTITVYHTFHDEVDYYRQHVWACDKCGNLIKRAMNRDPNTPCGPNDHGYFRHKKECDGHYIKIHQPEKSLLTQKPKKQKQSANAPPPTNTIENYFKVTTKAEVIKCPICDCTLDSNDKEQHVDACLLNQEICSFLDGSSTSKVEETPQVVDLTIISDEEEDSNISSPQVKKKKLN
ncbi:hypothetical protein AKO1_008326 [Acrasis kona]|uniref:SprT-like domain-containing protein n=1 Tax=Acrasis kona TaxID=1008807 RepID=A0AAW2YP34_9EUKA